MYQIIHDNLQEIFINLIGEKSQPTPEVVSHEDMQGTKVLWQNPNPEASRAHKTIQVAPADFMKQRFAAQGLLRAKPSVFGKSIEELVQAVAYVNAPAAMLTAFEAEGVLQAESRPFGMKTADFLK